MERIPADEFDRWHADLYKPLPGRSTDRVSDSVIEDEMAAFHNFAAGR